jgi:tetratricopeptide (TPR) repeat protein
MDLEKLLARAFSLADDGEWGSVVDVLREHLADFGDEASVHCALGVAEREIGNDGIAYECFKKALALQPEDAYVLATAGNGVAAYDDPDALEALKSAALLAPDVPVTRMLYGAYLAREGHHDQAIEQLEAARELDSTDPLIAYELGVAFALAGQIARACDSLRDAVQHDPDDGWARVVFGLLLLEDDRLEEAAGELIEGARMRPEDVDAQILAALAAGGTGLDGVAYEMLERGRMRALEGDVELIDTAEQQIDAGAEAAASYLDNDVQSDALRVRLKERP